MLVKTRGVNTHKGMLFVTGIVKSELNSISNINNTKLTHGEELFIKYNTTGVRGEIEKGLPIIFDFSKDFYKNSYELSQNDRLVHTLIGIMQYLEDSNIIYRHSPDILKEVQKKSRYIISIGGMKTIKGRKAIEKLNDYFNKNIQKQG